MKRTHLLFCIVFCLLSTVFLWGCGGGGAGDTVGVYDTVTLTATPAVPDVDSDVATWTDVDEDGFICGAADTYTIEPDTVSVTIASDTIPNLPSFVIPSSVRLTRAIVSFTPVDILHPPLPSHTVPLSGYVVDPGGSVTIAITVAPRTLKSSAPLSAIVCAGTEYTYYVTIDFEGVEVLSGTDERFIATITVRFADLVE